MRRLTVFVMLACFTVLFLLTAQAVAMALIGALDPHRGSGGDSHRRVLGRGQIRFDGAGPERWALRYRRQRRLVLALRRELARQRYVTLHDPDVSEAIGLAATTYNVSESLMFGIARCESGLNPQARNPSSAATGVFQILVPSTWDSTPYARFSPVSPYANALAAAHMLAHGRRSEWVC